MKLSIILESKIRIAHVGAIENDFNDEWHIDVVFSWLYKRNEQELLYLENSVNDYIELNEGRDFLHENYKYDIVILHHIYNPIIRGSVRPGFFNLSASHNRDNWVKRLMETEAKYIFTFGDLTEVSGQFLGKINGYDGPNDIRGYAHVYIRKI